MDSFLSYYLRGFDFTDAILFGERSDFLQIGQSVLELFVGGLEHDALGRGHEIIFQFDVMRICCCCTGASVSVLHRCCPWSGGVGAAHGRHEEKNHH